MIAIVAAIGRNRELGKGNQLLWHIPDDLKRFKALTTGHPVIMGRKTFESIVAMLGKPLPGRKNIVVTRNAAFSYPDVLTADSIENAIEVAKRSDLESPELRSDLGNPAASLLRSLLPENEPLLLLPHSN